MLQLKELEKKSQIFYDFEEMLLIGLILSIQKIGTRIINLKNYRKFLDKKLGKESTKFSRQPIS